MRLEGWESRLQRVLSDARTRAYKLGEWDCFRLACQVIEALRGENLWPRCSGYTTRREALLYIARYGSSFEAAFDVVFGVARCDVKLARRGDLVAIATPDGEKHLGVCIGVESVFLTDAGVVRFKTMRALCCWRID